MFNDDVYESLQKPSPPCIPLLCWGRLGYFASLSEPEVLTQEKEDFLGADELQQYNQKRNLGSISHSVEKSTVPKSVDFSSGCKNESSPNNYADNYKTHDFNVHRKKNCTKETKKEKKNSPKQKTPLPGCVNIKNQFKTSLSNKCLNSYTDAKRLADNSADIPDSEIASVQCKVKPNYSIEDTDSCSNIVYTNEVSLGTTMHDSTDRLQEYPENPETNCLENSHKLIDVESCPKVQSSSSGVSSHINHKSGPKQEQWLVVENIPGDVDLTYVEDYFKGFGQLKQFVHASDNEGGIRLMVDIDCEEDWFIECLNGSFAFGEFTKELSVYRVSK